MKCFQFQTEILALLSDMDLMSLIFWAMCFPFRKFKSAFGPVLNRMAILVNLLHLPNNQFVFSLLYGWLPVSTFSLTHHIFYSFPILDFLLISYSFPYLVNCLEKPFLLRKSVVIQQILDFQQLKTVDVGLTFHSLVGATFSFLLDPQFFFLSTDKNCWCWR